MGTLLLLTRQGLLRDQYSEERASGAIPAGLGAKPRVRVPTKEDQGARLERGGDSRLFDERRPDTGTSN